MRVIQTSNQEHYPRMTTAELRSHFLIDELFHPDRVELVYTDLDRAVVGGIAPRDTPVALSAGREMACEFFCERREVGVLNLGATGTVTVDGRVYPLAARECLYIGRGSRDVLFASREGQQSAQFLLVSYPAHATYPTTHATLERARRIELGSAREANRRTIFQYIHPGGMRSCQLVMGFTELHEGSVWNTFPPHTHDRRTELYCYFDLPENGCVTHLLGTPVETRHLIVREKQVALSPAWSIHAGAGTGNYRFAWAMGGENQVFEDMDKIAPETLR